MIQTAQRIKAVGAVTKPRGGSPKGIGEAAKEE